MESFRDFIDSKVQQARQELTLKEKSELAMAMAEAESHLTALVGKAGGKTDGSWKIELHDDSSWEEVQREAQYHLFKHDPTSKEDVSLDIEQTHDKLAKAMEPMVKKEKRIAGLLSSEAVPQRPEGFGKKFKDVTQLAKVTLLEIKFLKALSEAPSLRSKKLKERISSMSRHGLSLDDIQPTLWKKITQEMMKK